MFSKNNTEGFRIFSKVLFFIGLLLLLFSCYHRTAYIDDAWLGEYAFWFSKKGYVTTNLFSGVSALQGKILVYPRLHIWIGGLTTWLFGFKLYALKATSLLWLTGLIGILYKIYHRKNNILFWSISGLVFIHFLFLQFSFIYRPEIGLATLGILAFYFAVVRKEKFASNQSAIMLGIICGISFLLHRNGIVYIASIGCLYLITLKPKPIILFSLVCLIVGGLYFYDFGGALDFTRYQSQMAANFKSISGESISFNPLINLIKEHERYFRNIGQISFSILFLYALVLGIKIKDPIYRRTVLLTLLLMGFMAIANPPKTSKYMIPLIPFWSIVIVQTYMLLIKHHKIKQLVFVVLLLFYCCTQIILSVKYISTHQKSTLELNQSIAQVIEPNSKVLTPISFVFDHIEDYDMIQCHRAHRYYFDSKPSAQEILNYASTQDLDYVILSPKEFERGESLQNIKLEGLQYKDMVEDNYVFFKAN